MQMVLVYTLLLLEHATETVVAQGVCAVVCVIWCTYVFGTECAC